MLKLGGGGGCGGSLCQAADSAGTFFEGAADFPMAQRGYSRDQRSDCKQVCIGLVVSRCGMPLGYEVFPGNTADVSTVEEIVTLMEQRSGKSNRIWVMDRGMVSEWKKLAALRDWTTLSAGCYLLRTNVLDWTDEELWKTYMQLTEAEAAFRIHKADLSLRPIWHQKQERVLAHILVCFLGYVLWKTLGQLCRQAGLGDEPRRVLDELAEIRLVDVVLPTRDGRLIRERCVSHPTDHQQILLDHLKLRLPARPKYRGRISTDQ